MTLNMEDELDMTMRAPYISMCENDDLPLLTSDDLMWSASCLTGSGNSGISNANAQNKFVIKNEFGQTTNSNQNTKITTNMEQQQKQQQQNNENNVNINSKPVDSSLAALLCGNVINLQSQSQTFAPLSDKKDVVKRHTTSNTCNNNNDNQIHVQQPHLLHSEEQSEICENGKKYKLANDQGHVQPMVVISPYNKNCK